MKITDNYPIPEEKIIIPDNEKRRKALYYLIKQIDVQSRTEYSD
jgi:hypothetical protein